MLAKHNHHNVVADVPGRDPTLPAILIGCHLDSWDLGTGAIDDAADIQIGELVGIVIVPRLGIGRVGGARHRIALHLEGGEAIQLTKSKYGVGNPKWSPDGKQLLFAAGVSFKDLLNDSLLNPGKAVPVWSLEKPGMENTAVLKNTALDISTIKTQVF